MEPAQSSAIEQVIAGQTVARLFLATVEAHPDVVALRWKDGDAWREWSYGEYADRVARAVTGWRALGVEPGDRVVLMMRNRPEFHVADLAALFCGATPVSIYNSSASDQVEYLAGHAKATIGLVEDDGLLGRFAPVRSALIDLGALGVVEPGELDADFTWADLLAHEPADLAAAAAVGQPEDLATVIYTSGTTGPPKGVMITNRNVCFSIESLRRILPFTEYVGKRLVSYLPMAHIAERMVSHYQPAALGYEVTCCPEPGAFAAYAREVHPNVMFGVPRVWEKLQAGVVAAIHADPEKGGQFDQAVAAAEPIALRRSWGEMTPEDDATWAQLDAAVFGPVRAMLGLDQVELASSGAAPIPASLLSWYLAVGIPLSEVYGMSENTGAMTYTIERVKPGTVGPAMPGTEVVIADDGEVLCRGGHVFPGYLDDPEKTAEALDSDGWLHSGDIGELDEDGYLRIVDRKKELIITAGGKNISPANLEAALKTVPLIGQACAIGDQRPFVSALVVLDGDAAPQWAKKHGIEYSSLTELARNPDVIAEIEKGVAEVMAPFNGAERVKKVRVLGDEWLPDSDLLTPTSKLKRRGIHAAFGAEIEALYAK
ncbi:MAG: AMP-binding enzyme [Acidimicrobiales bacterium]|nr:AMP-binding enzyme [Acidimicrobiales bacterium]